MPEPGRCRRNAVEPSRSDSYKWPFSRYVRLDRAQCRVKMNNRICICIALFAVATCRADEILFQDDFTGTLAGGWSWVREDPKGWRVTEHGLEVRLQPGNMWGPANNAKNVLIRAAPDPAKGELEISVTVSNQPSGQYEQ